jgi:hypothetical protein
VKSKTYVVSWDRIYQNSLDIDRQLFRAGFDYLVYNDSSKPELNSSWIRAEKVFFLGHFYNSLMDFIKTDYPVFIFNAGDAVSSEHAILTKRAEYILTSDPTCWVYAPSVAGSSSWSKEGSSIVESKKYVGLHLSTQTDAIWVALSRELVEIVIGFFEWMFENNYFDREFKKVNIGWGLDSFFCAVTVCMNKKIYRDWQYSVFHDSNTSYDHGLAAQQMMDTIKQSIGYTDLIGIETVRMQKAYDVMYDKVNTRRKLTVADVYKDYPNVDFEV